MAYFSESDGKPERIGKAPRELSAQSHWHWREPALRGAYWPGRALFDH
jgi:hypothetical protein